MRFLRIERSSRRIPSIELELIYDLFSQTGEVYDSTGLTAVLYSIFLTLDVRCLVFNTFLSWQ